MLLEQVDQREVEGARARLRLLQPTEQPRRLLVRVRVRIRVRVRVRVGVRVRVRVRVRVGVKVGEHCDARSDQDGEEDVLGLLGRFEQRRVDLNDLLRVRVRLKSVRARIRVE